MALSVNNSKALLHGAHGSLEVSIDTNFTVNGKEAKKEQADKVVGCSVEGCENPFRSRGLCVTHYNQWRRENVRLAKCRIDGCDNDVHSGGMCAAHVSAERRLGDPNKRISLEAVSDTCIFKGDSGVCGKSTDDGGRSLCRNHYQKLYRLQKQVDNGKAISPENRELLQTFWSHKITNRGTVTKKAS